MSPDEPHFHVGLAMTEADLMGAHRLRYRVFVEELGGDGDSVDHEQRFEIDGFDEFAEHLVLIDDRRDAGSFDHVVGVYRLMDRGGAEKAGRFYSAGEYDLSPLLDSGRPLLELGRSCVHADYRGGTAMYLLWSALADQVSERGVEVMFGVASFHGTDPDALAEPLSALHHRHLAPEDLRVKAIGPTARSMDMIPEERIDRRAAMRAIPALIKAYLRLGGTVGEGAWIDHDFNTTDVCLVMDTARLTARRNLYTAGP